MLSAQQYSEAGEREGEDQHIKFPGTLLQGGRLVGRVGEIRRTKNEDFIKASAGAQLLPVVKPHSSLQHLHHSPGWLGF